MGDTLVRMAMELVEEYGISRSQVASVGMGFPGLVDNKKGVVIQTVNIPIRCMPVAEMFRKHWNLPVYLGNDADCAALGEYYHCGNEEMESLILVTLGTGIGTGIILNGRIHTGINGCAGEGGHIVIVHGGEQCTCGNYGCFERYASATAIIREARKALAEHPESSMMEKCGGDLEKINAKIVIDSAKEGDATAKAAFDQYVYGLAVGIINIINLLDPEVIVLGGGVSAAGEFLLDAVREAVKPMVFFKTQPYARIELAQLGNDAGIIGAAMLGR